MPRESFLPTLRELVRCYQAFEVFSAAHVRTLDLTPPQFDIIATLGNTPGMTFKELGEKTLITKGTLTGVVDRLEQKGLVRRVASATDRRSTLVELTGEGDALFQRIFPAHMDYARRAFGRLSPEELTSLEGGLARLREAFTAASQE
ncbi:MAG: MarR family transcriptional regulator [Betaproteobacteria bacterium]|nr:MarR family transcriptional regulator [Betaproteobacteria bacterium]